MKEVREGDEIVEDPRGGRKADTVGEAEGVAFKDLEGVIKGGRSRYPGRVEGTEDGAHDGFVCVEDGGRA